ncbi:somatostatin receptor type 5-like [Paramacrobiotus metropolitanus]|uniref:somatostatin receptor type 5-like n=1 Tax=Paramacrobiotus metropolitanus TaxID=2943436 RepID=UPI0024457E47|nr:somatostatin receptor type 5-like [Paramacrobiotus metropolitanus]
MSEISKENGCLNTTFGNTSDGSTLFNFINAINSIISVVGLGGNILVFYVICRFSSMRTITNIFIMALSLADIAFLVNVPLLIVTAVLENWIFGDIYCKVYYVMTTVNQFASSFLLVTMSADRYFAVCQPVISRKIRTPKKAILACCLVWFLAILLMCPVFLYSGTISKDDDVGGETNCNIVWPDFYEVQGPKVFALYCFVLGFALPVIFMFLFYGLVLKKLHIKQDNSAGLRKHPSGSVSTDDRRRLKFRRVSAVILVLMLAFLICWTPYWAYQIHITFLIDDTPITVDEFESCQLNATREANIQQQIIYTALFLQCLCYANSAINPILYSVLSRHFKQSYAKAWKCYTAGNRNRKHHTPNRIPRSPYAGHPIIDARTYLAPPSPPLQLCVSRSSSGCRSEFFL